MNINPLDDPWKAVDRIKARYERVVATAVTVVNCAEWQGGKDARAVYLAEAVAELKVALNNLQAPKSTT